MVFVHGLFGQGKNWTTIAKGLADRHRVTLRRPAQPRALARGPTASTTSTWSSCVATELEQFGEPVTLVGHSMGGKVAMQLALRRPELLRALVVVDIAPVDYPATRRPDRRPGRGGLALRRVHRRRCGRWTSTRCRPGTTPTQALRAAVPSRMVRSFLLQSLVREGLGADGGWRWRLNLDLLGRDLGELRGFPQPPAGRLVRRAGALDRRGELAPTCCPRTAPHMDALFPATRLVRIKNAGHWVHSEQPEVFLETLRRFLDARRRRSRRGHAVSWGAHRAPTGQDQPMTDPRAGQPAQPSDLVDVASPGDRLLHGAAGPGRPGAAGRLRHVGPPRLQLDAAFNEAHILATTQAICEYRAEQGYDGPLFVGRDTHGLSEPAWATRAGGARRQRRHRAGRRRRRYTPTPAVSHAILAANRGKTSGPGRRHRRHPVAQPAPGRRLQVQPAHRRPGRHRRHRLDRRAGPTSCSPPGSDGVRRVPFARARAAAGAVRLPRHLRRRPAERAWTWTRSGPPACASAPTRSAAPASTTGATIADRHGLDLTVVNPLVDPTWRFMTLDWDGKIRMDCSSPSAPWPR